MRVCGNGGAGRCSRPYSVERRVVVGCGDVAVSIDEFADVFRQINRREVKPLVGDVDCKWSVAIGSVESR